MNGHTWPTICCIITELNPATCDIAYVSFGTKELTFKQKSQGGLRCSFGQLDLTYHRTMFGNTNVIYNTYLLTGISVGGHSLLTASRIMCPSSDTFIRAC
jgi:hypothetical protein